VAADDKSGATANALEDQSNLFGGVAANKICPNKISRLMLVDKGGEKHLAFSVMTQVVAAVGQVEDGVAEGQDEEL
jgi:hypothetical protein